MDSENIYSNEELLKLFNLSKEIRINSYHTKTINFNDENNINNSILIIGDTPYEFIINNNKVNEVEINISIPKNKINKEHKFTPLVFIKFKDNKIYYNELLKENEDDNFVHFKNKISWDYDEQSSFQIKGILYDYSFV